FQQVMLTMFQKFSDLHWGQRDEIQQELRRLQEITSELDKLQCELAQRSSARPVGSFLPESSQPPQVSSLVVTAGLSAPGDMPSPPLSGGAESPPPPFMDHTPHAGPVNPQPDRTAAISSSLPNPVPTNSSAPECYFHDFLTERIAAIQAERQGR